MTDEQEREHRVKLRNRGLAARVIHDGERPVLIPAGGEAEATLSAAVIARLKAERQDNPDEPPPLDVIESGEAAGDVGGHDGGHEGGRTGHKRRPPPG